MKTAVLIPGMLRNFEVTHPRFKTFIMDELNPDIFFSGYPNEMGIEHCEKTFTSLYKPKKHIIREYTDELRKMICPNQAFYNMFKRSESTPNTWMSGVWNVKMANLLRKEYEQSEGIKYDLVIKCRIDTFFYAKISQKDIQLALEGNILIPNAWDFKSVNPIAVSDVFAMSTPDVMDIYCDMYDHIDGYVKSGDIFHPESLCGRHIAAQGLKRIEVLGDVPNPFGHWGCGWMVFENPDQPNDDRKKY